MRNAVKAMERHDLKRLTTRGVAMEEVKQEFIPLPDINEDPFGGADVRSGSELTDPLPSRMTQEYSDFLHRFDDAGPADRTFFDRPLFDGADSGSPSGGPEKSASLDLPVEVIPAADELETAVEFMGSDPYFNIDLAEKRYGSSVDENNEAEKIIDSGSFSLSDSE